jgi:gliding motility-associated-like protein
LVTKFGNTNFFTIHCKLIIMTNKNCTILALLLFIGHTLFAQREAWTWYFGYRVGLSFANSSPVPLAGSAMWAAEGCASWSDSCGNLLFYSNAGTHNLDDPIFNNFEGGGIWNRNHQLMYDIPLTEGGDASSAQGALILPVPGSNSKYYLFTVDYIDNTLASMSKGIRYYMIDMNLNGTLGGVVLANQLIYAPAAEALSAAKHENGIDYWLISINRASNDFIVTQVTPQGIQTPILQPNGQPLELGDIARPIKVAPNGDYICHASRLYKFNQATGEISFWADLSAAADNISSYTFSFSPKSRYIYTVNNSSFLQRFDVTATDIEASKEVLVSDNSIGQPGMMQIGPDGNIYLVDLKIGQGLSVIMHPDDPNPVFNASMFMFNLSPTFPGTSLGLPNYPDWLFNESEQNGGLVISDTIAICPGQDTLLMGPSNGGSYLWNNGATTQNLSVTQPGTYELKTTLNCRQYKFEVIPHEPIKSVAIEVSQPVPDMLCPSDTLQLRAVSPLALSFLWSTGQTSDVIRVPAGTTYKVTATDGCGASAEASQNLAVGDACCQIQIPNAFTPNNDGTNDSFTPILSDCNITAYRMRIFDRWGKKVFETKDPGQAWDGKYNNAPASMDEYVYTINYTFRTPSGQEFIRNEKGGLSLLR